MQHPLILEVVDNDLCIACGACVETCPKKVVEPEYNAFRGAHEIKVISQDDCVSCDAPCEKVCPSIEIDFPALLTDADDENVTRRGRVKNVYTGYSPEHRFNGVSSSGGIVRAIIFDALANNIPVLCLAAESTSEFGAQVLTDLDETSRLPGSIYHSVSFDKAISRLRDQERPVVLVAIPCQLAGIQKHIQHSEPELGAKILLKVGIICGWMFTDHALGAFASFKGITEPIINAAYRGEDQVGKLKILTKSEMHTFTRRPVARNEVLDYKSSFSSPANRLRCRLCEDHINLLADIAVGDAWLQRNKGEKLSLIVTRTTVGEDVIRRLASDRQICLSEGSFDDVIESQSENLVFGETAKNLNLVLQKKQKFAPSFLFNEGQSVSYPQRYFIRKFRWESILRWLLRSKWYATFRLGYSFYRADQFYTTRWWYRLFKRGGVVAQFLKKQCKRLISKSS